MHDFIPVFTGCDSHQSHDRFHRSSEIRVIVEAFSIADAAKQHNTPQSETEGQRDDGQ